MANTAETYRLAPMLSTLRAILEQMFINGSKRSLIQIIGPILNRVALGMHPPVGSNAAFRDLLGEVGDLLPNAINRSMKQIEAICYKKAEF